jgi:hypothetical protein
MVIKGLPVVAEAAVRDPRTSEGSGGLAERAGWVSVPGGERDEQRFWLSALDALRQTVFVAEEYADGSISGVWLEVGFERSL